MVAMIFMRPPQRQHAKTSTANTLRNRSAHAIRDEAGLAAGSPAPHAAPRGFSAGAGASASTISDRHFAFGASVPWYLN